MTPLFFPLCVFVFGQSPIGNIFLEVIKIGEKKLESEEGMCWQKKNPFEATGEFLLSLEMAVVGGDNIKAWIFQCD